MPPIVFIGVASYRRRGLLDGLIAALDRQNLGADTPSEAPDVRVVIVDNSPEHELAGLTFVGARFPVAVVHEPEPGISAARNRVLALARAQGGAFLAFIDDDERPDADWLARLLAAQVAHGADVVVGAVRGEPAVDAPAWIGAAGVFDMEPPTHGRAVGAGYTSNVLIRLAAAGDLRFDARFGLTGGEDTLFFAQLHLAGARFASAPDAIVREPTAPERARLAWLMRRWARTAISEGEIERALALNSRLGVALKGVVRLTAGASAALVVSPFSAGAKFGRCAKHLRVAARGWGFLLSAVGIRIVEYRR